MKKLSKLKPGIYNKDGWITQIFKDGTIVSMSVNNFLDTTDILKIDNLDKNCSEITFKVKDA